MSDRDGMEGISGQSNRREGLRDHEQSSPTRCFIRDVVISRRRHQCAPASRGLAPRAFAHRSRSSRSRGYAPLLSGAFVGFFAGASAFAAGARATGLGPSSSSRRANMLPTVVIVTVGFGADGEPRVPSPGECRLVGSLGPQRMHCPCPHRSGELDENVPGELRRSRWQRESAKTSARRAAFAGRECVRWQERLFFSTRAARRRPARRRPARVAARPVWLAPPRAIDRAVRRHSRARVRPPPRSPP